MALSKCTRRMPNGSYILLRTIIAGWEGSAHDDRVLVEDAVRIKGHAVAEVVAEVVAGCGPCALVVTASFLPTTPAYSLMKHFIDERSINHQSATKYYSIPFSC